MFQQLRWNGGACVMPGTQKPTSFGRGQRGRDRNAGYSAPLAQIPACATKGTDQINVILCCKHDSLQSNGASEHRFHQVLDLEPQPT